ncbi:MAG TPA: HAD family hydrolase [Thermoanaerobaculia bacterium]|nr:HAD family hydrolase [Thermoanaerobaculia bacterium]
MRLVLFDIDGTLLRCGPQVRPLFAAALQEVYGTTGVMEGYSFAGKTDPRIVLDLMTGAGVPEAEVRRRLPAMRRSYLDRLESGLDTERMALLPGVADLLERLVAEGEVTVGLLTGNWERGARIKLSRFGLERYFAFGAFGDDGVHRAELPPVALARAELHAGRRFAPDEILIIGDTVEDVACARAHSFHCLGVATGWTPAEMLRDAGAAWVADDLPAAGRLLPLLACGR